MQYLGDIPLETNRSGSCGGSNDIECALHRLCHGDITGRTIVRSYQELYQPEELETMTQILRRALYIDLHVCLANEVAQPGATGHRV